MCIIHKHTHKHTYMHTHLHTHTYIYTEKYTYFAITDDNIIMLDGGHGTISNCRRDLLLRWNFHCLIQYNEAMVIIVVNKISIMHSTHV